jgi:AcrR family transcriptional regulator
VRTSTPRRRSAREQFTTKGYAATAVTDIAATAGVNVDTIYASVGRKPTLMLAVIDMTLASADHPLAAEQRDYVQAVLAAPTARRKLTVYAAGLGRVMPKVAPLFDALAQAALTDLECAELRDSISARRAANMHHMVSDLRSTGGAAARPLRRGSRRPVVDHERARVLRPGRRPRLVAHDVRRSPGRPLDPALPRRSSLSRGREHRVADDLRSRAPG